MLAQNGRHARSERRPHGPSAASTRLWGGGLLRPFGRKPYWRQSLVVQVAPPTVTVISTSGGGPSR